MRNLSEIMTMRREIAYETDLHGFGEYPSASTAPGGRKKAGTAGAKAARQTPAGTSEKAAQAGL